MMLLPMRSWWPAALLALADLHAQAPPELVVGRNAQYRTIQAAIDAAPAQAVVRIAPGLYEECLSITKPLTLRGAGSDQVTVRAPFAPMSAEEEAVAMLARQGRRPEPRRHVTGCSLVVRATTGVVIEDLELTQEGGMYSRQPKGVKELVSLCDAGVRLAGVTVIGGSSHGVAVRGQATVELQECLVAAVAGYGVIVADLLTECAPQVRIADSELRGCRKGGVVLQDPRSLVVVDGCRITGSEGHAIGYFDAAPTIRGNFIGGNGGFAVHGRGASSAQILGNLFADDAVSCWYRSRDRIVGNTFVRDGVLLFGGTRTSVRRNLFLGCAVAIRLSPVADSADGSAIDRDPDVGENAFFASPQVAMLFVAGRVEPRPHAIATRAGDHLPGSPCRDLAAGDYALLAGSPLRRLGIGAADPLPAASTWPRQAQEPPPRPVR